MATEIRMPQLGVSMETGTVLKWHKKIGDEVGRGEAVVSIETEKLTSDVESEVDGVVLEIAAQEGEEVPIQGLLAVIGEKGEAGSKHFEKNETAAVQVKPATAEAPRAAKPPTMTRVKASPLARKTAAKYGIDLSGIQASGTSGRITQKDVLATVDVKKDSDAESAAAANSPEDKMPVAAGLELMEGDTVVKLSGMRRVVTERMLKSHIEIPCVTQNMKIDVTRLMKLRKQLNEETNARYSVNDLVLKATAKALKDNKHVLVSYDEGRMIRRAHVNIGMAVALDDGLIVPVIKDADKMNLDEISAAAKDLATRARENKLRLDEYKGSTFSVSNLGMFGVETFTPIINQPDAAILGVCAIQDELALDEEGNVYNKKVMRISLTYDHRVMDGAVAARFQQALRELLENPLRILL